MSRLEWRTQLKRDCSNVYPTHLICDSHWCFYKVSNVPPEPNGIVSVKDSECYYFERETLKLHSWQWYKLIIPSFFVNFSIGASLYIVCLKHLNAIKIENKDLKYLLTWKIFAYNKLQGRTCTRTTSNSYLEMTNGLQSVFLLIWIVD